MIEKVFVAPIHILVLSLVLEKCIHKGDVVSLLTHKFSLSIGCFTHLVLRA